MRNDQKPRERYTDLGGHPTSHTKRTEADPHRPSRPTTWTQTPEAEAADTIDLRDPSVIDVRVPMSGALAGSLPDPVGPPDDDEHTAQVFIAPPPPPGSIYVRWLKPVIDRVIAAVLLVVLSPLILVIALGIWMTLRRPILFRQVRVGRYGAPFVLWKFRTMHPDRRSENLAVAVDRRVCHKSSSDPRHTRFGRSLRRSRLDELPQLVNVLAGDMSLVGPRPELLEIVARYEPWQHDRHVVRPGITGLWQVSTIASGMMHENTDLDLQYIREMDLRTDLRILLHTPVAAALRRGS